jgi:ABC-type Mn2+/Zn2+ transport system permease subunit
MNEYLTYSLGAAIFVGFGAGYIGSLMVLKRMALVGDALSHVALPGLALGILLNFNPFVGAFAFLFLATVATWCIERATKLSLESIIGVLFVLALAVGILITPEPDLLEALFGDITKVTVVDFAAAVLISVFVIVATRMLYAKVVLSLISDDLAKSTGIQVARTSFAYLFLVTLVVAIGIKIVGTLLVGALVIVPAAAAKNVGANLSRYTSLSGIIGLVSAVTGVLLSSYASLPAGPLVVISGAVIFFLTLVAKLLLSRP